MKLCPNPACPHRVRKGYPAEFLDRAETCSDCTMPLVAQRDFGTPETERKVDAWHEAREQAVTKGAPTAIDAARRRVRTGIWLIVSSGLLLVISYAAAALSESGGYYYIAVGPFAYGLYLLMRNGPAKNARPERNESPYR